MATLTIEEKETLSYFGLRDVQVELWVQIGLDEGSDRQKTTFRIVDVIKAFYASHRDAKFIQGASILEKIQCPEGQEELKKTYFPTYEDEIRILNSMLCGELKFGDEKFDDIEERHQWVALYKILNQIYLFWEEMKKKCERIEKESSSLLDMGMFCTEVIGDESQIETASS